MRRLVLLLIALSLTLAAAERRAKNIILFIGDAGGIPTLNGASIYGYGAPQKLFIQRMAHHGLMDTSPAGNLVTDSAAGMTAIVTGQKVNNGVISSAYPPAPGQKEGEPLMSILEYAEQRGLSTGVISNSPIVDATPAACYAHVPKRSMAGEIFSQVLKPRFGDGVDLVIGPGRQSILAATEKLGLNIEAGLREKGYAYVTSPTEIPKGARRAVALLDSDFDLEPVVSQAIETLSRNPKGFFLMVENDIHTTIPERGLKRAVALDKMIEQTVAMASRDTLIIFTADHSYDFRISSGKKGEPLALPEKATKYTAPVDPNVRTNVRVFDSHTGEEVLVAAQGPGAERVHGFFANSDLFRIMMAAYGWDKKPAGKR